MTLHNIIFGENDAFLREREAVAKPDEKQKTTIHIVPEKFRNDVDALMNYIGEEKFLEGLSIEVTLTELLDVVPRTRRRADAYDALARYLKDERGITLTIKTKKNVAN